MMKITAQLTVAGAMVKGKGEDSESHAVTENEGYISVFDGCGGLGSKRYERAKGHTGAYLASRLMAKRLLELQKKQPGFLHKDNAAAYLQRFMSGQLKGCKSYLEDNNGAAFKMKGDLQKSLPTTAVVVAARCYGESAVVKYFWAGDSRGYILTRRGLAQVTADDIDGEEDAFSNLSSDSRLENMLNADAPFVLNEKKIKVSEPCILLAATDGVFGYMPTPMAFENLLLQTLLTSESILEWEMQLKQEISSFASDDFTLSMVICGFKNFEAVKAYFGQRGQDMLEQYFKPIEEGTADVSMRDSALWEQYRQTYEEYL